MAIRRSFVSAIIPTLNRPELVLQAVASVPGQSYSQVEVVVVDDRFAVRIKTLLSPIHHHDLWTVRGQYGYKPTLPAIGGSEAVGTVDAAARTHPLFPAGQPSSRRLSPRTASTMPARVSRSATNCRTPRVSPCATVTPEPSTVALVVLGVLGIFSVLRRRRATRAM